jgi:hypothetical protein
VARQIDVDKVPEGQFADHMALVDKVDGVFHTQEEAYKFVKENRPYKITKDYADVPRTHTLSSPSKYTEETSVWRIFEVKRPYKEERVMPVEKEIYRDGVDIIDDALDNTVFRVREKDLQAVTEKINAPLQSPGPSQSFGSIPLNKKIIEAVKKGLSPIAMLPFMGWLLFGGDNEAEAGIISSGIKTAKDIAIKTAEKTAKTAREAARITAEKTKAVIPKAKLGEPSTKGEAFLKDVVRMQEKSEQQNRLTLDKAKRFLNTSIVDVKGHTKRALASYAKHSLDARLAIQRLDLIGGAHSKAIQDSSAAEAIIYGGLSKSKHILLDAFINAKRTIEIIKNKGKKFKVPPEFKKAQAFLDEMSPALKAELEPRAKAYWETFDALVAMMKAENLLSPEALAGLRKSGRNYSPRKVLEYFDPELTFTFGESKIIKVGTSGLKPLEKGTIKDIETNTSILLNEAIVRAHTRVFRNRANKSLYDFAKNVPHNGIVTLSKVVRVTKSGKQIFQKPLLGYDRIPVMIKGKRKEVLMRHEFAKGWVLRDPILNPAIANTLSWVSGSKILKAMATGLNPEFSLTNLPRDLAHILLITDEYSRTLPVAFIQLIQDITMIIPSATGIRPIRGGKSLVKTLKHKGVKGVFNKKDLQKVLKDTFNREGLYRDYINYGGGMEFMTHQGKFARSEFGRLTKVVPESVITQLGNVQTYLGYVGETSEIIGRLALMRRAMKNGATLEEATWIARTYLDFSQGGNIVKAMDSSVPYLNASIQGTRGIFRAARDKPGVFGYKAAQIGTASIMLYLANKYMNPEALKQIPPEVRAANWIITTPFSYLDKYGNRKYFYIKIAKDHGQRLIASLWENLFKRMWYKDEFDYKEVEDAVDAFAPRKPSDYLPPTFEAILGYAHNKDFWLKKEIWEGGKLSKPFEEYTSYTHPFFVELGQLSKDVLTERISLSPERTRIALSQVFTRGNPWTSLAGFAWKQIFKDLSQKEQDQVTAELIMSQPFLRRVLSGTDPVYEHGQMLKRVAEDSRTDIYAQNRDFDRLSQDFLDRKKKNARLSTRTDKAIQGFIKGLPKHVVKRLTARHKRRAKLQGITNIRMWLLLADIDVPENRARAFWNIWREGSKEEREQLIKDANKAPDIKSRRFIAYFNALKRQTLREEEPTLKRRQALQEEK